MISCYHEDCRRENKGQKRGNCDMGILYIEAECQADKEKRHGNCTTGLPAPPILGKQRGLISPYTSSPTHTMGGGKNCRKAGAGVYIGYRVYCHLIHSTKFSTKKTFHATSFVVYIFYVSTSFIFHLLYPKLFVVSYPIYFVEL